MTEAFILLPALRATEILCNEMLTASGLHYYINDAVIVATSGAAIRTAFNLEENEVFELMPVQRLIAKATGGYSIEQIVPAKKERPAVLSGSVSARAAMKKFTGKRIALGHHLSSTVLKSH